LGGDEFKGWSKKGGDGLWGGKKCKKVHRGKTKFRKDRVGKRFTKKGEGAYKTWELKIEGASHEGMGRSDKRKHRRLEWDQSWKKEIEEMFCMYLKTKWGGSTKKKKKKKQEDKNGPCQTQKISACMKS